MRHLLPAFVILALAAFTTTPACDPDDVPPGDTVQDTTPPSDVPDTAAPDTTGVDTHTPPPDIVTTPGTVQALRAQALAAGCNPDGIVTIDPEVDLNDVVVTSPRYVASETANLHGYFVADQGGGEFSGINIVFPMALDTDFQPGQVLDLTGSLQEVFCFTQLSVTSHTDKGTIAPPSPVTIAPSAVGEPYESMLIKVDNVTVLESVAGGVYRVTGGFLVSRGFGFFLSLDVGASYDVTGNLQYAFNEWRLLPRSQADLQKLGGGTQTTIQAIQSSAASTECTASGTQTIASDLDFTGVVTTDRFQVSANLHGYYMSDGTQEPYSGILMTAFAGDATNFQRGDVLAVNGRHQEFHCMTQFALDGAEVITDSALTPPEPLAIAHGLPNSEMEKYEGMLVELSGVTVTAVTDFNESDTNAGVLIDGSIMGSAAFTAPAVGTTFSTVRGMVRWSFSRYRVAPRSAADLITD